MLFEIESFLRKKARKKEATTMCHSKLDKKQALIDRIARAGCPIETDPAPDGLTILQKSDAHIMDMGHGYIGVMLYMMLARDAPGQIVVEEFGNIFLPGTDLSVIWLDPLPSTSRATAYTLQNGFSFDRDDVLNDKLGESGIRLRRGEHVEGVALGWAKTTLPESYSHGALLHAQFSVVDILGREHRGDVEFIVDRKHSRISLSSARRGEGLYAPDQQLEELHCDGLAGSPQKRGGRAATSKILGLNTDSVCIDSKRI